MNILATARDFLKLCTVCTTRAINCLSQSWGKRAIFRECQFVDRLIHLSGFRSPTAAWQMRVCYFKVAQHTPKATFQISMCKIIYKKQEKASFLPEADGVFSCLEKKRRLLAPKQAYLLTQKKELGLGKNKSIENHHIEQTEVRCSAIFYNL